jgi:hypothetical protein
MSDVPRLLEAQVVASREQAQQDRFASRRKKSIALALISFLACVTLLIFGFWTSAICALFVSLIGVSNYFAANGHLHRLRKRARHRTRLARDFSKIQPAPREEEETKNRVRSEGVPSPKA